MSSEHLNLTWTATERRILRVLADGLRHSKSELMAVLNDDMAGPHVVNTHICRMRKKLQVIGQDIVCVTYGLLYWYQHIVIKGGPSHTEHTDVLQSSAANPPTPASAAIRSKGRKRR